MKRLLLPLGALLLSTSALAYDCTEASTQIDLNTCANERYEVMDKKLNQTYPRVLTRADPAQRGLLKKAQLAWIKLRDADCEFMSSGVVGGSIHPKIFSDCLADITAKREAFLASQLRCEEGDPSCPLPPP